MKSGTNCTLQFQGGLEIVVDSNNKVVASNKPELIGFTFVDETKWMECKLFDTEMTK